jgi:ubiquinone/menaquinone biosynthesis C-methylase UbiE
VTGASDWEAESGNWLRWARTPGHDSYWYYRDAFFDHVVPPPTGLTLEVGCGEGRVARDLRDRGHRVVAMDTSPTLLRHAKGADPSGRYVQADAMALPFGEGTFDLVVAYNALMDVDDMPGAVSEAARVLVPGGRFAVSVTHHVCDAGAFTRQQADAPFVITDSYLGRRRFEGTFERAGLVMTFRGWCHSLEDYARAIEDAGMTIERIREPAVSDEARERAVHPRSDGGVSPCSSSFEP